MKVFRINGKLFLNGRFEDNKVFVNDMDLPLYELMDMEYEMENLCGSSFFATDLSYFERVTDLEDIQDLITYFCKIWDMGSKEVIKLFDLKK